LPSPADVVEALLFASDAPLEAERIREVLELAGPEEARALVEELRTRYAEGDRALTIAEVGGGYRMVTRPEVAPWLLRLARTRTRARLSRPALETLAIVAYRQPVSRPEVDAIRGVNSEGTLDSLLERRLLRIAGRKEAPGRPFLYETTREFLVAFGLRDLAELPKVDGELIVPDLGALDGDGSAGAGSGEDGEGSGAAGDAAGADASGGETGERLEAGADGQAAAEQDPGPGGTDVPAGR
jgi:segregation and condensation protein B